MDCQRGKISQLHHVMLSAYNLKKFKFSFFFFFFWQQKCLCFFLFVWGFFFGGWGMCFFFLKQESFTQQGLKSSLSGKHSTIKNAYRCFQVFISSFPSSSQLPSALPINPLRGSADRLNMLTLFVVWLQFACLQKCVH